MHPDTRNFLGIVLSLLVAAGLTLALCQVKAALDQRPRSVPPIVKAR
jgi:hypothetical protein